MILPSPKALWISLSLFLLNFSAFLFPFAFSFWPLLQGLLLLLVLVEALVLRLFRPQSLHLEEGFHPIGRQGKLSFLLSSQVKSQSQITLHLEMPPWCLAKSRETDALVMNEYQGRILYPFLPVKRGSFRWDYVAYRLRGFLGLAIWQGKLPCITEQHIVPDMSELRDYLKLKKIQARESWGYMNRPMNIQSGELDSLREYTPDDEASRIEWRASTRIQKPVVKVYRPEATGWITLILDCGRWMQTQSGQLTAFDRAINSLLVLAQLAFHSGDSIRLIGISDQLLFDRAFGPRPGEKSAFKKFLSSLEPQKGETNPLIGFEAASRSPQGNSLILFLSQIWDKAPLEQWKKGIRAIRRKAPILLAFLKDGALDEMAESIHPAQKPIEHLGALAAQEMSLSRQDALNQIRRMGVSVADVRPENLTAPLINNFLALRQKGRN